MKWKEISVERRPFSHQWECEGEGDCGIKLVLEPPHKGIKMWSNCWNAILHGDAIPEPVSLPFSLKEANSEEDLEEAKVKAWQLAYGHLLDMAGWYKAAVEVMSSMREEEPDVCRMLRNENEV